MKEIVAIIAAYEEAGNCGEQVSLATVVHVEGSSYRKPGARMLVTEKGVITGAISGGCLEGDALRKALNAIAQQKNTIVTYDTTDEDITFGVQLGCNGIVHILFEYIDFKNRNNPIELLKKATEGNRSASVICTLFTLNRADWQIGTTVACHNEVVHTSLANADSLLFQLQDDALEALQKQSSFVRQYEINGVRYNGFIELVEPSIALIIVGAGNDAIPVVDIAKSLGWQVTLVDGRATHANRQRFTNCNEIIVAKPEQAIQKLYFDVRTAVVLMTHNYNYDIAMLSLLLDKQVPYIGSLGPRKKMERMISELQSEKSVGIEDQLSKVYGPVGLDIGAETPEEVAISIIAEVKAVLSGKSGSFLKSKETTIHERFNGDHLVPVKDVVGSKSLQGVPDREVFSCTIQTELKAH